MGMGAGTRGTAAARPSSGGKPAEEELSELKGMARSLKQPLHEVLKRIDDLEKKE